MRILKLIMALAAGCCLCTAAGAQKPKETVQYLVPDLGVRLRTNPFSFIEPDGHAVLGMEWRWNKSFSAGMDAGFIFYETYSGTEQLTPAIGYKIRPEFRFYFTQGRTKDWFVAGELNYKRVAYDRFAEVCITGRNGFCDFFQRVDYKEIKRAPGFSFKMGFQQYIGPQKKLYYELFLGAGVKHISRRNKFDVLPPGVNENQLPSGGGNSIFDGNFEGPTPHIPAGIKIGIRL